MAIRGVDPIDLAVSDIDRSLAFYTLASVTIDNVLGDEPPSTDIGGGCTKPTAYARVRTIDNDGKDGAPTSTYDPKLTNRQFIVWFRGGK